MVDGPRGPADIEGIYASLANAITHPGAVVPMLLNLINRGGHPANDLASQPRSTGDVRIATSPGEHTPDGASDWARVPPCDASDPLSFAIRILADRSVPAEAKITLEGAGAPAAPLSPMLEFTRPRDWQKLNMFLKPSQLNRIMTLAHSGEFGGSSGARTGLEICREAAKAAGFNGIYFVAMAAPREQIVQQLHTEDYDVTATYHYMGHGGLARAPQLYPFEAVAGINHKDWERFQEIGKLPNIWNVSTGWDARPLNEWAKAHTRNPIRNTSSECTTQFAKNFVTNQRTDSQ